MSNGTGTTDTVTGTTGKAGPKGLGIDRTGITDHLALTFFLHLVVFSNHPGLFRDLLTGSLHGTEGVPTPGILPAPIRSAQRMLSKARPLPIE